MVQWAVTHLVQPPVSKTALLRIQQLNIENIAMLPSGGKWWDHTLRTEDEFCQYFTFMSFSHQGGEELEVVLFL